MDGSGFSRIGDAAVATLWAGIIGALLVGAVLGIAAEHLVIWLIHHLAIHWR